jgi:hypothetical protein
MQRLPVMNPKCYKSVNSEGELVDQTKGFLSRQSDNDNMSIHCSKILAKANSSGSIGF